MKFDLSSAKIRKYLVTGVLVWVPVIITIAVIAWGMGILQGIFASVIDAIAAFLPTALADEFSKVKDIPGLGVILVVLLLFFTGMMAANFLGQWFLRVMDSAVSHSHHQKRLRQRQASLRHSILEQRTSVSQSTFGTISARRRLDGGLSNRYTVGRGR